MAATHALADAHGRVVTDLRIAVTRDCNLSCFFCHKEGASPGAQQMAPDELGRLVRVGADLGVRTVKLTGGEPLLRPDLEEAVAAIRPHVAEVSLVTNGHGLERRAAGLARAGLDRINLSLHDADAAEPRPGRPAFQAAARAVVAAHGGPLDVKVNFVVTRQNAARLPQVIAWAQMMEVPLQLIELHANPAQWALLEPSFASLAEAERLLRGAAGAVTFHRLHARPIYHLPKAPVEVTRPMDNWRFCAGCQRLRVTADGKFQTCLLTPRFLDVLGPMRRGCTDGEVAAAYLEAARLRAPTWRPPREEMELPVLEAAPWP